MEALVIIALLAAGAWFSAYHCRKQQKFYNEHAEELSGEVISWDSRKVVKGRYRETVYELEIFAENGETYRISTSNGKARKYKNRRDITILVPRGADPDEGFDYLDELIAKEKSGSLTELETEKLRLMREIEEQRGKVVSALNAGAKRLTIIKEDKKSSFELWLSVFMGVVLTALLVVILITYIASLG